MSENEYQLIDSNLVSEADGSYAFDIYHNSTYVMTTNNLSPAIVKKIVTFKDGDTTTTKEVVQGEKVSEPATPTKQGYTFDGWYLNNQKFDFNTVISEDITLVAKWTKVKEEVIDDTKVDVIVPSIDTTHDKEEVVIGVSDKEEVKQVISDSVSKETKEVIVNAIKNGKQVATNVRAEKIDLTKVSEVVKEEVKQIQSFVAKKNMKVVDYLDLSVFVEVDGQVIEQLTQTNKPLTFQIALPDQLMKEGRTFYVIRLHDGKSEVLETTLTNGVLSFTTDKFSTYALVYEDVEKTTPADQINDKKVETGDSSHTNELWLLLGFALVVISGLTLKRKIVK
ncbi:MAG: hypothetical protein EOM11_05915 [Erysipelotrichia bacterium]|nr:hypothetical protein [Erysipelotrichia bacterium]